jgi:hypothetical protein
MAGEMVDETVFLKASLVAEKSVDGRVVRKGKG